MTGTSTSILIALLVCGCASPGRFPNYTQHAGQLHAGSIVQSGLSLAVWLEDQCETQEQDDRSATILEALHDGLTVPTKMLIAIGAVTVVGTAWSLYDRVTTPIGESLPNRPEIVMHYVTPRMASPRMNGGRPASNAPITWSACLSNFNNR